MCGHKLRYSDLSLFFDEMTFGKGRALGHISVDVRTGEIGAAVQAEVPREGSDEISS